MTADDDRFAELANICAGHAASTLAMLLDATLLTQPPRLRELPAGRPLRALFLREERVAGIFADLAGAIDAKAALLLSSSAVEELVARVAGKEAAGPATLSILAEVGNIAVSAAANALAEMLGATSLPSVPRAGYAPDGELGLADLLDIGHSTRAVADVVIYERHGSLRFHFVLVPAPGDID
ncbi:MAG TPA: chemotaxis protein CheC [Myxococcota bacterium]|nr:chemotaxis protein CheC [Myxococcota bacterium]